MEIKYTKNTLFHSVGFDFSKLYSILKYGLLSSDTAKKKGVSIAPNHIGYNMSDTISAVRSIYTNNDYNFAYNKYIARGISISMEVDEKDFIYNKSERIINHIDEVLIKDEVPKEKFTSIIIPEEYADYCLQDLPLFNLNSTSFANIKNSCDLMLLFMKEKLNYQPSSREYQLILEELLLSIKLLSVEPSNLEYKESFTELKCALSEYMANNFEIAFSRMLGKSQVSLEEVVSYINKQTLNLPVYIKKYKSRGR